MLGINLFSSVIRWRQPVEPGLKPAGRPEFIPQFKALLTLPFGHVFEQGQAYADYDRWFHAKVQASLDGIADGSNRLLSDEEVAARRAALRARLESMRPARSV